MKITVVGAMLIAAAVVVAVLWWTHRPDFEEPERA
jgi:hypothetical protein